MTETDDAGVPADVVDAFERHDAFDAVDDDRFALDTTAFDVLATASATDDERAGSFTVTMAVPTLSASVADADDVADVVEDGWFETFERPWRTRTTSQRRVTAPNRPSTGASTRSTSS